MTDEKWGFKEGPEVEGIVKEAWSNGCLVVVATIGEGALKGRQVMSIVERANFEDGVRDVLAEPEIRQVVRNVKAAIHELVVRVGTLTQEEHKDLMDDLVIMMALKLTGRTDLIGSGLLHIAIAVAEDESLPWDKRGMLDPELEAKHGFQFPDDDPTMH